ncbi:MAG: M48 family metallopeptidase [Roseburia sp.]|nr:M48 family metallopeptidase [Roseburia sp.]MCM1098151.1 M48 family metallopeptidase [Ruminococcus flavefaciens]
MTYKVIVMIILAVVYLYGMLLKAIQWRSARNPIPANVADVYDRESYQKWRSYHAEKSRLGLMQSTVSFVIEFLLILFNVYAAFAGLFPEALFLQMFAVLLLSAVSSVVMLPFTYYDTMVIEEKYGFNRSTKKTFWLDQLKNFLIELSLLTVIGALLMGIHRTLGDWFIPVFAIVMTLLVLAVAFLYPIFSKVFNKFTPLEDGELKDKLTGLLEKYGYHVRAIQVMDASRRSTKSNAYFSGFGKMKTIVLYDTLIQAMTPEEICAVFAHEMGHGLHRDTLKNQVLSFLQMIILGLLAWFTLQSADIFKPFGFSAVNYGFALLLIMGVEFALVAPLFGLLVNAVSRRAEYRADAQAVQEGYGEALVSALKKLAKENFADLAPDPLLVKLEYSHPTLSQRIEAIEKQAGING